MKFYLTLLMALLATSSFAKGKLIVEAINSPVKETYAKFSLKNIDPVVKVFFKPKNGGKEIEGELEVMGGDYVGKFRASELPVGQHEFRVRVTTTSGNSGNNEAKSVDYVTFSIHPSLEVPDPGEDGKKDLAGYDVDKSGVRDDVQRWVNENYPMDKLPSTNQALKQVAKYHQASLVHADDKTLANKSHEKALESLACFWWIKGTARNDHKLLKAVVVNTEARIRANLKVQEYRRGSSAPESITNTSSDEDYKFCNFKATKEM